MTPLLLLVAVTMASGLTVEERLDVLEKLAIRPIRLPGEGDWIVAFRVQAGLGQPAFDAFNNVGYHDDTVEARSTMPCGCYRVDGTCDRHYRSSILDNWAEVQQVKISLFKAGVEKASITFDASGTNYNNWLNKDKVISSTWTDLSTAPINYFSIQGHAHLKRRFFMNSYYNGCPNDIGWLVVKDEADVCTWGKQDAYPAILFASGSARVNYNAADVGLADVMAVSVKLASPFGAQCSA